VTDKLVRILVVTLRGRIKSTDPGNSEGYPDLQESLLTSEECAELAASSASEHRGSRPGSGLCVILLETANLQTLRP
jgi:hypothetical protein